MALVDPQTVTVNAVAKPLPRVASGDFTGTFASAVDGLQLRVWHTEGRRNRSNVRLDVEKIGADVLIPSTNRPYSMSVYLVVDTPLQGFTTAEIGYYLKAVSDWVAVAGNQTKVLNHES
jgi:hypothetical protein